MIIRPKALLLNILDYCDYQYVWYNNVLYYGPISSNNWTILSYSHGQFITLCADFQQTTGKSRAIHEDDAVTIIKNHGCKIWL